MHKRITFIILVCLMITIIGCGKEDSVCSENIVHEMTLEILDPNSESCVENMIPIYYGWNLLLEFVPKTVRYAENRFQLRTCWIRQLLSGKKVPVPVVFLRNV